MFIAGLRDFTHSTAITARRFLADDFPAWHVISCERISFGTFACAQASHDRKQQSYRCNEPEHSCSISGTGNRNSSTAQRRHAGSSWIFRVILEFEGDLSKKPRPLRGFFFCTGERSGSPSVRLCAGDVDDLAFVGLAEAEFAELGVCVAGERSERCAQT